MDSLDFWPSEYKINRCSWWQFTVVFAVAIGSVWSHGYSEYRGLGGGVFIHLGPCGNSTLMDDHWEMKFILLINVEGIITVYIITACLRLWVREHSWRGWACDNRAWYQVRKSLKQYVLKVLSFACGQEHDKKQKGTIKILVVLTASLGLSPAIKLLVILNFGCCLTSLSHSVPLMWLQASVSFHISVLKNVANSSAYLC